MRIDILTLFPEFFASPLSCGLLGKAAEKGIVNIATLNIRDFSSDGYVDDAPFGGGSGMVMEIEPVYKAARSVMKENSKVIILSPSGERFCQKTALELSASEHLILICGRYEGIDARTSSVLGAREISIGDFILSGGEAAALSLIEAVARVLPGFLGNPESLKEESFNDGDLEYPHYTRPADFMGYKVPEVLLSGNHGLIKKYRESQKRKVRL